MWAAAGPFGGDLGKPSRDKADVCVRLDHAGHDGGQSGAGGVTAVRGGVSRADHGDTRATDDGELLTAVLDLASGKPADAPKP